MAARKPKGYKVIGAVAVVRNGKHERYVYRGGVFGADAIDEANAKHLLGAKLIAPFEPAEEPAPSADAGKAPSGDDKSGGGDTPPAGEQK